MERAQALSSRAAICTESTLPTIILRCVFPAWQKIGFHFCPGWKEAFTASTGGSAPMRAAPGGQDRGSCGVWAGGSSALPLLHLGVGGLVCLAGGHQGVLINLQHIRQGGLQHHTCCEEMKGGLLSMLMPMPMSPCPHVPPSPAAQPF